MSKLNNKKCLHCHKTLLGKQIIFCPYCFNKGVKKTFEACVLIGGAFLFAKDKVEKQEDKKKASNT